VHRLRDERTPEGSSISSGEDRGEATQRRLLESATATHGHGVMSEQLLIIGGGQSAVQAIHTLRQNGYAGRICVIGGERHAPYQRPRLSKKYLAGQIPRERLALRPEAWYSERGVELVIGAEAVGLDGAAQRVGLADGSVLDSDALLLATGSRVRR